MKTCKDCIHYNACSANGGLFNEKDTTKEMLCNHFKDNSLVLDLPCKVGDTVWYITGIHRDTVKSAIVEEIIINCNGVSDLFVMGDFSSFENSVDMFYPTREAAEQALKEREQ